MSLVSEYFLIVDLILGMGSLWILFRSYRKGLLRMFIDVACFLLSLIVAFQFSQSLAHLFPIYHLYTTVDALNEVAMRTVNISLWFLILVFFFRVVYWIICYFLSKGHKVGLLSFLDHVGGMVIGCFKVYLILCCFVVLCRLPGIKNGSFYLENTILRYVAMTMQGGFI